MDRLNKALMADSTAIMAGSFLGTSSTTAYIESASGVQAGGRTGLTAVTVAVLFLACLFIAPLAGTVPGYATAPALLYVSCLMLRELLDIDWNDVTEVVPAVLTALGMPFYLFRRQWRCIRLHHLRRAEAAHGARPQCAGDGVGHRSRVHFQVLLSTGSLTPGWSQSLPLPTVQNACAPVLRVPVSA